MSQGPKPSGPDWSPSDPPRIDPKTDRHVEGESLRRQIGTYLCHEAKKEKCPKELLDYFERWVNAGCDYRFIVRQAKKVNDARDLETGKPRTASRAEIDGPLRKDINQIKRASQSAQRLAQHPLFRPYIQKEVSNLKGLSQILESFERTIKRQDRKTYRNEVFDLIYHFEHLEIPQYLPGIKLLFSYLDDELVPKFNQDAFKMTVTRAKKSLPKL